MIEAWADRTAALSALPGIEQVFPFENRGEAIGVTLHHPHGQIYAYPYITPDARDPALRSTAARPTCSPASWTSSSAGERVVLAGEHWTAFVPFAARWPLEVHLLPHRHVADFAETTDAERDELATALPAAAARHRRALRHARPRTSPPGTRRRCTAGATRSACICSSPRRAALPTS